MAVLKRIYVVTEKATEKRRLVDAVSIASAIRHVALNAYSAAPAKPRELAELIGIGVQIEESEAPTDA